MKYKSINIVTYFTIKVCIKCVKYVFLFKFEIRILGDNPEFNPTRSAVRLMNCNFVIRNLFDFRTAINV